MEKKETLLSQQGATSPKHSDPEYLLKGIQAFALGVVLFGVSLAVAQATLLVAISPNGMIWLNIIVACFLIFLSIPIALFGCMALILGFSMTGLWKPKGAVPILTFGINVAWFFFAFAIVSLEKL